MGKIVHGYFQRTSGVLSTFFIQEIFNFPTLAHTRFLSKTSSRHGCQRNFLQKSLTFSNSSSFSLHSLVMISELKCEGMLFHAGLLYMHIFWYFMKYELMKSLYGSGFIWTSLRWRVLLWVYSRWFCHLIVSQLFNRLSFLFILILAFDLQGYILMQSVTIKKSLQKL